MKDWKQNFRRALSFVMAFAMIFAMLPPTAAQAADTDTITVYFRNDWMWTDVCIHYWGGASDSTWPGDAMTLVGTDSGCDVYAAEIPADTTGMIFNGTKNDGSGATDQSPDITSGIADGNAYYMHWDNGNQCSTFSYTPSEDSEEPSAKAYYLVGFLNGADYNGEEYAFVDGKLTVTFTNDSYVAVKDGAGDWYLSESYCTNTTATLAKGNSEKMFVAAGAAVTFTLVENEDGTLTLSYTTASSGEGEGEEDGEPCTVTLHFADSKGWGNVALYSWDGTGTTLLGGWPGTSVSQDADGFYTHSYEVAAGQTVNFIFNNGGGSQTADLSLGTVTGDVEKWVRITGESDGKYTCELLDEAFVVVRSPIVDGTSVTFMYDNASASSVSVRGDMNDWGETAMTKDENGIWTLTIENLEPGTYEYKFYVNGSEWVADPVNSWIQNENSAFIILNPDAEDKNEITVNIHYTRADGDYDGWNMYIWNDNGTIEAEGELIDGVLVTSIVLEGRAVQNVNVIPPSVHREQ